MTNMLGDLRGTPVASVQVVSTNVDGNICKYHLSIKNQISRLAMCMLGTCCQIILQSEMKQWQHIQKTVPICR